MNRNSALLLGGAMVVLSACSSDPSGVLPLTECSSSATPGSALSVPIGGVKVLGTPQSIGCVVVPSTAGAEYLFVVSNASATLDDEKRFSFTAKPDGGTAATTANLVTAPALVASADARALAEGATHELALRRYEREHLDPRDAFAHLTAERSRGAAAGASVRREVAAVPVPAVGQLLPFRVPGATAPCDSYDSVTAVVKYVSNRAIILQDVTAPANGFTDSDFQGFADEFDSLIYPTDVSYFGAPTDIDNNAGHIYILFTPAINRLTPATADGITAGFFFAGDFFPRTGSAGQACKQSNGAEIFYLLAPDPTGTFGKVQTRDRVLQLTRGTVAHEFQHMINAGIRFNGPGGKFEDVWLDEGMAHFAEEAVGRAARGFGDLQPLASSDVKASTDDYLAYFDQNLRRFALWLAHPDTSSGVSERADANLSSRGAAWALVRYASEKYPPGGDVRAFTRQLAAGPEVGIANLTKRSGVAFDSILVGFEVANFADELSIPGLDPRYTYTSWNMRDAVGGSQGGTASSYPLLVNLLASGGGTVQGESRTGASTYARYSASATASTPVVARLLDASQSALATYSGARLYVLRVK